MNLRVDLPLAEPFQDQASNHPSVSGFLHRAESPDRGLVLAHGAGGNCNSPLLVGLAEALARVGVTVLRLNLPFRQRRPFGPPLGTAEEDQAGLHRGVQLMREQVKSRVFVGGHSYGGRMASMLCARESSSADGLLLISYPLHPPRKPQQLRTAHLPSLHTQALFVHGTRDPFGSVEEMESALALIPAETKLLPIEGAKHELLPKADPDSLFALIAANFVQFFH